MNIARFFRPARTVESIIAPITKIKDALIDHANYNEVLKEAHDFAAAEAVKLANAAGTEAKRAIAAADKFANAFSL